MTQQRHQLVECGQSGHVQGQRAALGDGTLKKEREREEGRERRKKREEEEERGAALQPVHTYDSKLQSVDNSIYYLIKHLDLIILLLFQLSQFFFFFFLIFKLL